MTTIINTPAPSNDSGGAVGMIVGLVVLVVLGYLFFVFGLPAIRQMQSNGVQINVPSDINVNVTQPK